MHKIAGRHYHSVDEGKNFLRKVTLRRTYRRAQVGPVRCSGRLSQQTREKPATGFKLKTRVDEGSPDAYSRLETTVDQTVAPRGLLLHRTCALVCFGVGTSVQTR